MGGQKKEIKPTRFKRAKRIFRYGLFTGIFLGIGYFVADLYLDRKYNAVDAPEASVAEGGLDALLSADVPLNTFFDKDYLESLGDEYLREIRGYTLLEKNILDVDEISERMKIVHYSVRYRDASGNEEQNIGSLTLHKAGDSWTIGQD